VELKQVISVKSKVDEVYFDLFEVESVLEGTIIRAKSARFGKWIKSIQKPRAWTGGKAECWANATFKLPDQAISTDGDRILCSPAYDLFSDGQANMVWLFHGNLEEGWELLLPMPMSFNNLEDFFTSCLDELRDLYIKHLRSGKLSAQLSEVVEAEHAVS
jgi:hypothetical protein